MAKQLLLGNQAAAMGARDGGIAVISSYPGTPSTEITETAAAFPEVYTEWAANEKVAAEAALGSSFKWQEPRFYFPIPQSEKDANLGIK